MKFIKNNIKIIIVVILCITFSSISSYAATIMFSGDAVGYNNSKTGIPADNVQDALDAVNTCADNYNNFGTQLTAFKNKYLKDLYPVGSIYISVSNTNPETLFGGTWQAFGTGRTLVGQKSSDTDFDNIGETGGSKTQTMTTSNMPSHTHTYDKANATSGSTNITADNLPAHSHVLTGIEITNTNGSSVIKLQGDSNLVIYQHGESKSVWSCCSANTYINRVSGYYMVKFGNIDKYITTSTTSGASSASTSHSHSIDSSSATSGSTGSESAFSTQDPYVVVYMWKRTA